MEHLRLYCVYAGKLDVCSTRNRSHWGFLLNLLKFLGVVLLGVVRVNIQGAGSKDFLCIFCLTVRRWLGLRQVL
jgi:hypothetical protein